MAINLRRNDTDIVYGNNNSIINAVCNSNGHIKIDKISEINTNINDISVDIEKIGQSIYTSQNDSYIAETNKCQLISGIRNDSSTNILCDTNNYICPISVDSKGTQFVYVNGISGSVSITNSDITSMKNKIDNMDITLTNIYNILADIHDDANKRIRVLSQVV
jgi:hypothetical protein